MMEHLNPTRPESARAAERLYSLDVNRLSHHVPDALYTTENGLGGVYSVRIVRLLDFHDVEVEVIGVEFGGMRFVAKSYDLRPLSPAAA